MYNVPLLPPIALSAFTAHRLRLVSLFTDLLRFFYRIFLIPAVVAFTPGADREHARPY